MACISEEFQTCISHVWSPIMYFYLLSCISTSTLGKLWDDTHIYLTPQLLISITRSPSSVVHYRLLEGLFTQRMLVPLLGFLIQCWSHCCGFSFSGPGGSVKNAAFPNVSRGCWGPLIYSSVLCFCFAVKEREPMCRLKPV